MHNGIKKKKTDNKYTFIYSREFKYEQDMELMQTARRIRVRRELKLRRQQLKREQQEAAERVTVSTSSQNTAFTSSLWYITACMTIYF